ncbi:type II toxin-antitoxin system HigB family toxin [Siphonobacter curvatus]|uniref:Type II toxin-antitoxin system HigB family toxin n=1 Tax=Siphonobacter curvatus TaxID=2094562 RepID=A0A2S7IF93_9BACT|nr:type II toxin-antitoxin system HigB family toxin [Siphonobacter curvatus]PQA53419.1 type II toxin-antitoxin system HigB family toxin [Siphonobacter curvatus]
MGVVSKTIVLDFSWRHLSALEPLNQAGRWKNFSEMRQTFNSVDAVGNDRYVFNSKGNRFRLVAMIHFDIRTLYIRFVGTYADYDQINYSTV